MQQSYPTGRTVPFPYEQPYPQQADLMETLLSSLRNNTSVMLLESPTGTGKSLSLACSAMAWLRYQEQLDLDQTSSETAKSTDDTKSATDDWLDDWVAPEERERRYEQVAIRERARIARTNLSQQLQSIQSKLVDKMNQHNSQERRENLVRSAVTMAKMKERQGYQKMKKKQKRNNHVVPEDHCVTDYRSDQDEHDSHKNDEYHPENENSSTISNVTVQTLLDGSVLDGSSAVHGKVALGQVTPGSGVRKIIYAARTHSQLSQFVGELRRIDAYSDVRVVALGGRQVLCGNADVNKPGRSEQAVNDACLDLQKDKTSSCPLSASKEGLATLALHTLAQPSDIEDAAGLGKASHCCAYYASRKSLAAAEVVVMPYSMLLSTSARHAVGLSLKDALVLVDEAHNLPEAIRSLHSCRLSLPVCQAALDQLSAYTKRYAERLAGRNIFYLGQIRKCLKAFIRHLQQQQHSPQPSTSTMISAGELLMELKLDNVNVFKILSYLEHSRLSQKFLGFTTAITSVDTNTTGLSKHVSSLSIVQTFLSKLTSTSREGKIVTDWPKMGVLADDRSSAAKHPTLRFVALHPAAHFESVIQEARAIVLVGGTLRPFSHVAAELLDHKYLADATKADVAVNVVGLKADDDNQNVSCTFTSPTLTTFTCDHVVPASNVLVECLSAGPSNKVKLDFRHQSRGNHVVMDELGQVLVQLSMIVPAGMVVFLPSYSYEAQLVRRWKAAGIWKEIIRHKRVHREPKQSSQVESTLEAYSKDAKSVGALLLSVVGGKMSEGINFADDMARCVLVVGLPYPDITDPELKEKMSTMDGTAGGITGQAYYQNLCMRAVNQSVGRAIRHANDYAAIVLADQRYATDKRIWNGLPSWLKRGTSQPAIKPFSQSIDGVQDFFQSRK